MNKMKLTLACAAISILGLASASAKADDTQTFSAKGFALEQPMTSCPVGAKETRAARQGAFNCEVALETFAGEPAKWLLITVADDKVESLFVKFTLNGRFFGSQATAALIEKHGHPASGYDRIKRNGGKWNVGTHEMRMDGDAGYLVMTDTVAAAKTKALRTQAAKADL